jgi:hypothetical protein
VSQNIIDTDWIQGFLLNDFTKIGIFPTNSVIKVYLKTTSTQIEKQSQSENTNNSNNNYLDEFSSKNLDNNTSNEIPKYQYVKDEQQSINAPKQARVLYTFSRESDNQQIKYLNLEAGDYILVTENYDKHWVICENFKNEKGLFPADYIEYIEGSSVFNLSTKTSIK